MHRLTPLTPHIGALRTNADDAALASPATKLPSLIASAGGAGTASSPAPVPVRVDDAQSDAPAASSLSQRGIDLDATMPAQPGRGGGAALAPLWLMAARAYMQLRRWDDALTCIQNATAVAPGLADIYCVVRGARRLGAGGWVGGWVEWSWGGGGVSRVGQRDRTRSRAQQPFPSLHPGTVRLCFARCHRSALLCTLPSFGFGAA